MSEDQLHEQPSELTDQAEPAESDSHQPAAHAADPRVDAALRRSADLAATPPADHVEIYEDVHRTLQEVLADAAETGEAPGGDASGGDGDASR